MRLSSLVPHTRVHNDSSRHLVRAVIIFSNHDATVLIKWFKTNQSRIQGTTKQVLFLHTSPLCPVIALKAMLAVVPGSANDPLFSISGGDSVHPLTDTMVTKHLKRVLTLLNLHHCGYTFYTFRTSGASFAYNHGVPIEVIKRKGT